jgi:hypothetical protein
MALYLVTSRKSDEASFLAWNGLPRLFTAQLLENLKGSG